MLGGGAGSEGDTGREEDNRILPPRRSGERQIHKPRMMVQHAVCKSREGLGGSPRWRQPKPEELTGKNHRPLYDKDACRLVKSHDQSTHVYSLEI